MSKTTRKFLQNQPIDGLVDTLLPSETLDLLKTISLSQYQFLPLSTFITTVEQSPIAISITDKKAKILYVNQAFTDITGYQAEDVLGENESMLSDKSTPRQVYYDLWHTISRKQVWQGQLVNRRKFGQRYLADLTIAPMLDEQGNISHYIGMHRDITDAQLAEQQVKNQKQLIESVLNASPVAMVVLDSIHRIVLDNQMYKMLISELGFQEPALFFLDALQHDMGNIWEKNEDQPRGFSNKEVRVEGLGQRGTRWFSCSGNWFSEGDASVDSFFSKQSTDYLLLTINDITLQRRQQEKMHLQTLRSLMAEEEHIRGIRETLLGAMHKVSQPLNQIQAAIQLMTHRNDTQNQPLRDLLSQVQSMGVETLATLQRCVPEIPETAVTPVNLNQLLHEVMLLQHQKFLANGVIVDWLPNPVLPSIMASENKLRMLFKQLIDNAVNAMNRVSSRLREINISTAIEQNWVRVTIADTGPGIPANQRSKVFEPFFTTQQNIGGVQAGMGLVMAKEILNQHGGMIEIDPDYQKGCRVILHFPCKLQTTGAIIHE
ncbi:nitrogen fixation negative regulator NifL [Methylomonas lenta]|uniref:histidine kinase n=1 Tax=Methylomonas lenta TaxID=980561 RepID=A0A177N916_9GAMM|nr:nitrogen fixation negative regulator NifL [Methylomonas lenta]OAI14385.1 nitrogen fixation negative regulator NifL [Methylomonas lenta]